MRRKIFYLLATLFLFFTMTPFDSQATEVDTVEDAEENMDEDDFVLSKFGIEASFPEKYRYIYDENQGYRDEALDIGIHTNEITSTIKENNMSYDAFYIDDEGYLNEAYMSYDMQFGTSFDMKEASEDELQDLIKQMEKNSSISALYGVSSEYIDTYRTNDGEVYLLYDMESQREEGGFRSACYFTLVNGSSYYFYFRSYNPNTLIDDLIEEGKVFLEGVKFTCRAEKMENTEDSSTDVSDSSNSTNTSNIITGPKTKVPKTTNRSISSRIIGRAAGVGIMAAIGFLVNAVKRKKNDK
ncbi:hypothetical protein [Pseudobutyrivibrio sp.]|uniref:hypothetical protein n=1 Tax=Pseudobutyrivibrio sp. TaxID=2014367 RepID=UPI0025D4087E|nr:hypothetical protein [Pseudobutyrivibrio sp.]MBR5650557.1 hypothetical protein [Pseudobutyrivibrio sp.]